MVQLALLAFKGLGFWTKVITIVSVLSAIGIAAGVIYAHIYNQGYDKAIRDVVAQNKKAIAIARGYRDKSLECDARGLRWRTATGQCE